MKYVIQRGEGAPSCFPEGFDTSNLKDITTLTDAWRKYIDRDGNVVDCATFWAQCLIGGLSITCPPTTPPTTLQVGDKVRTGVYVGGEWQAMHPGVVVAISADGQLADVDIGNLHGGRPWVNQERVSHLRKEQS